VVEEAAGVRVVHGGRQLLERMIVLGSGVESLCDEVRYLVCQLDCGEIVHVF
jgi:hypothetical protein